MKQRLLGDGGTLVISAIHGLGSVGKSTLAAALAHDVDIQKHFCDGILWVTLGQEPNIGSLLEGWVHELEADQSFRAVNIENTSAHLRTLLYDKRVLLVVDDAWDAEKAKYFQVCGSRCQVLVTTRDDAIAHTLNASIYNLDVMTKAQAMELLSKKLKREIHGQEYQSAAALAEAVGYLPLALELAAAQVARGISWKNLLTDITQEIARLKSLDVRLGRDVTDEAIIKKHSLQASLNLSVQRLYEEERENFIWLGVLPEDATITPAMTATLWDMVDERDAADRLGDLRSQALLLPGATLDDGTPTYRLHDLFHDLARNLLTASPTPRCRGDLSGLGWSLAEAHSQLLEKYQEKTKNGLWHTLPDDGYIHQRLVWHLQKADKVEEIHQLLREEAETGNNGWYEVREKLGQTAGFVSDVSQAWELAESNWSEETLPQIVGFQCRYALIIASLNSLAANISTELLVALVKNKVWYPQQGLAYALQKPNLQQRADSLIALADYLPPALKEQALQGALEIAQNIEHESSRARVLIPLAEKLQDKSLYREALEAARKIGDEYFRARVLTDVAHNLQDKSLYREALEAARKIEHQESRARVLGDLAQNLPDENLSREVLAAARNIDDESSCAELLIALAKKFPNENLLSEALAAARHIESESSRARVLIALAEKFPDENLLSEVLAAARSIRIKDRESRARVLSDLAQNLPDENLYREALETARKIEHQESRARVLSDLAQNLPDENLYHEALEVARGIGDEESRAGVLSALAQELQDKNLYREVLHAARGIGDEFSRARVLSALAQNLRDESLYREALETARGIEYEFSRASVLSDLAQNLPASLYREALEVARGIGDRKSRAELLIALAQKLPDENVYHEALETARKIGGKSSRARVLIALAQKLPDENLYREALAAARGIKNLFSRAELLIALAQKLKDENVSREALETARGIWWDESARVSLLSDLAQKLQDESLYREALETARGIRDESIRAGVLSALAQKLPDENCYREALETARAIGDDLSLINVLSALPQKLPDESLYREALEVARGIRSEYFRARVLSDLAQKLSDESLYREALEIAQGIGDESSRARLLSDLAPRLSSQMTLNEFFSLWRDILHLLSRHKRQELQPDIASLTAVIFKLGGKEAILELASAILDVGKWWK